MTVDCGNSSRRKLSVLAVAATLLSGCSAVQLPAIDPTGAGIFLPPPAFTTLVQPCDSPPRCPFLPRPAFPQPPVAPPCDSLETPLPAPQFAVPGAPVQSLPSAVGTGVLQDRLTVTPAHVVAAVGSEVVLLAGICGPEGRFITRQPVEWTLSQESTGNFVDSGDAGDSHAYSLISRPARQLSNSFLQTRTSTRARVLTRGTPSPNDDVWVKKGQCWVSVSSAAEGVSHVTAIAPGAENWVQRRQTATIHWIDGQWTFPAPAIVPAGRPHPLTTTVRRASDGQPAVGWTVRYEVSGGARAVFQPDGQTAVELKTDALGSATAQLVPDGKQPGVTQIRIQVIPPGASDGASRAAVGEGWATVTWSSPGLAVRVTGPNSVAVDATATFRIEVSNPGDLPARNVVVSSQIPAWLKFLNSSPSAERFEPRVEWRLGDLRPREVRQLELSCRAVREGDVRLCAQAQADEGLTADGCVTSGILAPSLDVRIVKSPQSAKVGDRVTFDMEVTNIGTQRITQVTARDTFDPGLVHSYGERSPIVRSLGDLDPKGVSRFSVSFDVRQAGRLCHTVDVSAAGGHTAMARACVDVTQVVLSMDATVTGPPRRRVGETAEYVVQVTNTGQGPLAGVRITVYAEPTLLPEKASGGYQYREGGLIWDLGTLPPGESQSRTVQCSCVKADPSAEVRVNAVSAEGITRTATTSSEILAAAPARPPLVPPADSATKPALPGSGQLRVSVADTADPVQAGRTTSYIVTVQNDSPTADRNISVTFILPDGMRFERFDSGGLPITERRSPDGRSVAIEPIKELRAGETLRAFRVDVTVTRPGVQTFRVEVTSQRHQTPVVEEASTTVQASN